MQAASSRQEIKQTIAGGHGVILGEKNDSSIKHWKSSAWNFLMSRASQISLRDLQVG